MSNNVVTLKYPFDIKNIKSRNMSIFSPFSSSAEVKTYDVQCFGAVKHECTKLMKKMMGERPEYNHKIYAYRAVSKLPESSTQVYRIKFTTQVVTSKLETHTNMELLGEEVGADAIQTVEFKAAPEVSEDQDIEEEEEDLTITRRKRRA